MPEAGVPGPERTATGTRGARLPLQRKEEHGVAENAPLVEAALRRGGNRYVTVLVVPGGSHRLYEQPRGVPLDAARGLVPGCYQAVAEWLVERFVAR